MTRPLEKSIQWDIVRALRTLGFAVTETSQRRPSGVTVGIPDLYAAHPVWQLRFWCEVKRPGQRPTAHQRAWHETERAAGGTVLVATSVADVLLELGRLGAPIG
jgi:predicted signal transduction protein with EAL and GGDEF domain